jgi:hypothetical protein
LIILTIWRWRAWWLFAPSPETRSIGKGMLAEAFERERMHAS